MSSEDAGTVDVVVLEGLVDGWQDWIAKHDWDGSAEEYHGAQRAIEKCAEDIEIVIEQVGNDD